MARLNFDVTKLRNAVNHAASKNVAMTLVKDDGIYLMPVGNPGENRQFVVFASGYDPTGLEDKAAEALWNKSCRAVGGGDFAETIETEFLKEYTDQDLEAFWINLNATGMAFNARVKPDFKEMMDRIRPDFEQFAREKKVVVFSNARTKNANLYEGTPATMDALRRKFPKGVIIDPAEQGVDEALSQYIERIV